MVVVGHRRFIDGTSLLPEVLTYIYNSMRDCDFGLRSVVHKPLISNKLRKLRAAKGEHAKHIEH